MKREIFWKHKMFQENLMRVLRLPEVSNATGLSRSTIFRLMQAGDFPPSIKLTSRTVGWYSTDIETWIVARAAASKAQDDD
jgi:prophage regulatory protein